MFQSGVFALKTMLSCSNFIIVPAQAGIPSLLDSGLRRKDKRRRWILWLPVWLMAFFLQISPARAAESKPPPAIPRESLMKLGRDFLSGVGASLKEADTMLGGGAVESKPEGHEAGTQLSGSLLPSFRAPADEPASASPLPHDALMKLGREFIYGVGASLEEADLFLVGAGKIRLAEHKSRTQLPDDEPLIFHASAGGQRIYLKQDIYAVKRGDRLMVSLGDFCSTAGLSISVHPAAGTAEGWFIRENQRFSLDAKKGEAVLVGLTEKINPDDIDAGPDDILVSTALLEKWFGLDFGYNFADLMLHIAARQPLPVEEAYLRRQKRAPRSYAENDAVTLPFQETPYTLAALPYIDTNISGSWSKSPGSPASRSTSWSTIYTGDLAGFSTQAFTTGMANPPNIDALTSLRVSMGRDDPGGGLLGPLHATSYRFGDVDTVPLGMIGGGGQEEGARFTNKPADVTTATTTDIRGNVQPGWDVELYRNDSFINIRHAGSDGQYLFEKVDLVPGDNNIKLLFYGPRGEIREEHRRVLVDPYQLAKNKAWYSVSATRSGNAVWQPVPPPAPDGGKAHLAALAEYGIPGIGTGSFGIRSRSDEGVRRTFAQTELATSLFGTFLNAGIGYDLAGGTATSTFAARRTFGKQSVMLQSGWTFPDYNVSSSTAPAITKDTLRAGLSGPLPGFLNKMNYSLSGTRTDSYDGVTSDALSSSLSGRLKGIALSGGYNYNRSTSSPSTATASFNSRGFLFGGNWRLGSNYQAKPAWQMTDAAAEYAYFINDSLSLMSQARYAPASRLTALSLGASWQTSKASISPAVNWDTNRNLAMNINVHFGLGADPYSHDYQIYSKYMSAAGGVAGRIFLDRNGNGVYDGGDELMPDVVLKALQVRRTAMSNDRGIAFIPDLEQNRLIDISVDQTSFPDSYNMSLFKGVSVLPRPGVVSQVDFPVVVSGEMDGQLDIVDGKGARQPARNMQISLTAPDGRVEKSVTAAYDGYWAISSIRPGVYYLSVDAGKSEQPAYMVPEKIVIEPTGTTIYGHSPVLVRGHAVPFRFSGIGKPFLPGTRARVEKAMDVEDENVLLRLGPYHSRLGLLFSWYKFKVRNSPWGSYFDLDTPLSKITPDPKTAGMDIVLRPRKPVNLHEAAQACQTLREMKFDCSVEVVSHYGMTDSTSVAEN
ncbi:MAG: hypothetical protein V1721_02265 [Pseudomonadota bacterium]